MHTMPAPDQNRPRRSVLYVPASSAKALAKLPQLSPDAVIFDLEDSVAPADKPAAREVYVVRVTLPPTELSRVAHFIPKPGMPVEIMIKTEERTFAQYIAKPIVDSMTRAFREQ